MRVSPLAPWFLGPSCPVELSNRGCAASRRVGGCNRFMWSGMALPSEARLFLGESQTRRRFMLRVGSALRDARRPGSTHKSKWTARQSQTRASSRAS